MALHSAGLSPGLADNLDSGEVLARTILQVLHLDDVKLPITIQNIFSDFLPTSGHLRTLVWTRVGHGGHLNRYLCM